MRKAPESTAIDNPLFADRISKKEPQSYHVPQDVILENKHKNQLDQVKKPQEPFEDYQSRDKLVKDRSNEDLSLSS